MAILNALLASSAVAITLLAQAATPVNALAAPAHAARNAITPNHNGMIKRKRNTHKLRKRCVASQQASTPAPSSTPDNSGSTDNSGSNNSGSTDNSGSTNNSGSSNSGSTSSNNNSGTSSNNSGGGVATNQPACSGGKVGLAWAYDLASNYIPNAITGRTCYYYNWSSWAADSSLTGALKFVPMFWGGDHIDDFQTNVIDSSTNYGFALAMNEVNQAGQANIDPGTGAGWWRQFMLPLRQNKGYYIISPSTTSAPDGIPWMQQWLGQLGSNELPNALALHWYGSSFGDLQTYINTFASTFPGYKLWLTEFACTDFTGQNIWCDVPSFASQAASFLDNHPAIEVYFPFGFVGSMSGVQEQNRLMNGDGSVTSVGWEYLQ